jgi:indole-3-glycerol phosphate synthase
MVAAAAGILAEIFEHKRVELARSQRAQSLAEVRLAAESAPQPLDFVAALRSARRANAAPALIAEIKKASPSRGALAPGLDPLRLARLYAQNGAAAISVLTDERFFQGSLEDLARVHAGLPKVPLLRKDFILDPYQLYEARAAGASAALLIVAGLQPEQLCDLHRLALELGLAPLVEVHTLADLEIALTYQPVLLGVNNRDLRDFSVNLETTRRLRPYVPDGVCMVAESGIHTRLDVEFLHRAGADAILVGEALVTAADTAEKVRELSLWAVSA